MSTIDQFLTTMNANGGMSMANHFIVKMQVPRLKDGGVFTFYCDEAQLPNTQAATGTIKGRYMGEGQVNYPHTRIFTEMQLGFQCDARMTPLLFLNRWYAMIFPEYGENSNGINEELNAMDKSPGSTQYDARVPKRSRNRTVQLNYPDDYCGTIYVTKTELGPKSSNDGVRTSVTYVMERAWPFAIDAVPLQFGSASITKVTSQFYYSKHRIVYHNPTSLPYKLKTPEIDILKDDIRIA